jgi:hypothetical protein
MAHEDLILYSHPFADERVRRYLATAAYNRILLNLNESANFRPITNCASIQVHQVGMMNNDVLSQNYISGDH